MKLNLLIISVWGLLSFFTFSYCNTNSNKADNAAEDVREAQEDLDEAQQNYEKEWEKFKAETEAEIKENENSIASYRDMEKKDKDFSTRFKERIDELEAENARMKQKLNDHKIAMKSDWNEFKREFRHDMNELRNSLKDIGKDNVK